jgi:DNA-binding MurR/RpiR family transcriptional regulator
MFSYEEISSLNDLEILVYNYAISNPSKTSSMTIRQLADEVNVSSTTIMRFCNKIGCEGFSEFKYALKDYVKELNKNGSKTDSSLIQDFFVKANTEEFQNQIRKAAEIIESKDMVFFIGMSSSGSLAKYGSRFLSNLGKNAFYLDDPFYPTDRGFYDNTAIVALSVSGEQRFLFRQIDGFKKGGASIISITNSHQCTLAKVSDFNIAYYMPMKVLPGLYNITSQVPVVYILESIAQEVVNIRNEKHNEK